MTSGHLEFDATIVCGFDGDMENIANVLAMSLNRTDFFAVKSPFKITDESHLRIRKIGVLLRLRERCLSGSEFSERARARRS